MMLRGRLLAVLVVATSVLSACGDDGAPSGALRVESEAEVAEVVRGYLGDYIGGRGEQACATYAPAFRAQLQRQALDKGVEGGCPEALTQVGPALLEQLSAAQRPEFVRGLATAKVAVRFAGDQALATVTYPFAEAPEANRTELKRGREGWQISDLAVPAGARWP